MLISIYVARRARGDDHKCAANRWERWFRSVRARRVRLLSLSLTEPYHSATRQAAAVYLKNRVYSSYFIDTTARPDQVPIPPSDRNNLKSSIIPLIASSPSRAITVQLAGALKNVVARDFPEEWPTLVEEVKKLLSSGNIREVHAGCVTALEMIRAFRYVLRGLV